jgi:hypothetical protein
MSTKRIAIALTYATFVAVCLPLSGARAQLMDSLRILVGTTGTVATKDYQPLWLVSQRFGAIADEQADLSTHARISNHHNFGEKGFYLQYGIDLYNNDRFKKVFIQEGYVKTGFRHWELRTGRYEEIIGEVDKDLSSGSLGISGNALPIPKVSLAVTDYTDVPFTNGWLQFKGQFSHGWMGDHQYIKGAYLHEKTFYVRVGKHRLKAFGGIQHYAVWGGNRKGLPKIANSWENYWNVLIANTKDDGTVGGDGKVLPNRPGDHRGVIEAGLDWENDRIILHAYSQMPFEMSQGIDIRNIDRLWGLSYTRKEPGVLKKLLLEFLYTKQMNDFYKLRYRENYYNNGIYLTGWEYQDRIIGTPLFVNRVRGQQYFPEIKTFDWDGPNKAIQGKGLNIVNNRIIGLHAGALYTIAGILDAKTLITFTQNYGSYRSGPFETPRKQLYTLQEVSYQPPVQGLSLTAGLGFDAGDLPANFGFMLGVQWSFQPFYLKK